MVFVELRLAVDERTKYLHIRHMISPAVAKMLVSLVDLSPDDREVQLSYLLRDTLPSCCLDDGVMIALEREEYVM